MRAAAAGQEAIANFRQTELRAPLGKYEITRQGELESAAGGYPVDRRNDRLRESLDGIHHRVTRLHHTLPRVVGRVG